MVNLMSSKLSISTVESTHSSRVTHRNCSWQVAENLPTSFKYAWAGVTYAFRTQRNFRIHVIAGSLVMIVGSLLQVNAVEAAILAVMISLVLVLELLNTALEAVVDLTVEQNYHELAKIAKDCAAGAVLISAIASIIVGIILLLPKLVILFS
ncbi:MAG: diacylglycerol kinase family protein [Roseofilum sp. SBFL]|nr:diacylglycerol kinase family protein [Roseofilum sp. Belize Diploria]MBP0011874.1 diacylglycerol kinase family protein [Roseofilum sp. SID3]MBP0025494.1 diacylglycerol kinase family protein [Roseofilum sp. SID2]MBP0033010.1 diacylglycerol kinase family protein [Roseofilum sp. Belize BBD 4]MBP0037335.1 diacylglycerol kinase family protein [Roseofilum sp. SID1]MBP0041578.1 diacylglycerol kinase family protein [Roseofilum sp. SBFL]